MNHSIFNFSEMPLDQMWKEIQGLEEDIESANKDLTKEQCKIINLRRGFSEAKQVCFLGRGRALLHAIEEATEECLK